MYIGNVIPLPAGRAGMAARENRTLASPEELIDAQGVTFEERYIRKEAGVQTLATTSSTTPNFTGTFTVTEDWTARMYIYTGAPGVAYVKSIGSVTGVTNPNGWTGNGTTSFTITVPTGGVPVGDVVIVGFANNSNIDANLDVTVSDSRGNTWSYDGSPPKFIARARITTALAAGDTITITYAYVGGAPLLPLCVAAVADQYTNVASNPYQNASSVVQGTSTSVDTHNSTPAQTLPALMIGFVTYDNTTSTFSAGSGFTKRTEAQLTNPPPAGQQVGIALASRIDTTSPTVTALHYWYSNAIIQSGGTRKAATTQGSTTVTGSGGTQWLTGVGALRIYPGDTIRLYGASGTEEHVVQTVMSDTSLFTDAPWSTTFAATDYLVIRGPYFVFATADGMLQAAPAFNYKTLATGLSVMGRPGKFVVGGKEDGAQYRKLFYLNGFDVPRVFYGDGTEVNSNAIASPATDWDGTATNTGARPAVGVIHRDRLVLACPTGKDPHRLYLSSPTNHEDFVTAYQATTRRVRSDIGERIYGLASFQGVLWVWKYPVGIFYIDDSDLDPVNWVERTKSQAIGCAPSPYAVCPMDEDIIFMSATGAFHVLSAVDTLGGVRASDLSWHLGLNPWLRANMNLARLNQTLSVWYPNKKVALFSVPGAGSTSNNLMLKWDFSGVEYGEPVKFSYSYQNVADALAIARDTDGVWKPVIGETNTIKMLDRDARNKDGQGYTASYQTPHIDFSTADPSLVWKRKLFEALELVMEPVSQGTVTVQVYVDGTLRQTLTFDATKKRDRKLLRVGDGYTISFKVSNSTVNDDFKILSHLVYFKVGNEDLNR
jgi:hypothetical protein